MRALLVMGALLGVASAAVPALPPGLEPVEEPALPAGLEEEPALPAGLEEEPALPAGLEEEPVEAPPKRPKAPPPPRAVGLRGAPAPDGPPEPDGPPPELQGFVDLRAGVRLEDDPHEDRASLSELRLQLELEQRWAQAEGRLVGDFVFDPLLIDDYLPGLETGEGVIDLREVNLTVSPFDFMDLKIGRQILTWGTGDLLFVNDLFPKDWVAMLVGRDVAYLKAPSDAVKLSLFSDLANLDLVYTPRFDADRAPDRRRLSSWDPRLQRLAGQDAVPVVDRPDEWVADAEYAARLHRRLGAFEVAGYGYFGFWKTPAGADPRTGHATHPALSVYGASLRGPVGPGIFNLEGGWYDSRDDRDGEDPLIRDGELRAIAGYELEIASDLTMGLQYALEHVLDGEDRHQVTTRLTWLALSQRLTTSVFAFYSPDDQDAYLRSRLAYAIDDRWRAEIGGNVFLGDEDTWFGQFQRNTNLYVAVRNAW